MWTCIFLYVLAITGKSVSNKPLYSYRVYNTLAVLFSYIKMTEYPYFEK